VCRQVPVGRARWHCSWRLAGKCTYCLQRICIANMAIAMFVDHQSCNIHITTVQTEVRSKRTASHNTLTFGAHKISLRTRMVRRQECTQAAVGLWGMLEHALCGQQSGIVQDQQFPRLFMVQPDSPSCTATSDSGSDQHINTRLHPRCIACAVSANYSLPCVHLLKVLLHHKLAVMQAMSRTVRARLTRDSPNIIQVYDIERHLPVAADAVVVHEGLLERRLSSGAPCPCSPRLHIHPAPSPSR
jgi:hypothetical protein